MLKSYVDSSVTLARLQATRCWPYLDGYTDWLASRNYSQASVQLYLFGIPRLDRWLSKNRMAITEFDQNAFIEYRRCCAATGQLRHRGGKIKMAFRGVRRLHEYLLTLGVIRALPEPAVRPLRQRFEQWVLTHRGVRAVTLRGYAPVIEKLLDSLGEDPACYTAKRLRRFVLDVADRSGIATAKATTSSVRAFLRFLGTTEQCDSALLGAVPVIADWRLTSLPRYLAAEDIARLIASCDGMPLTARRDRSVLLLLWRLALRAGDVADLRLTDIDWQAGRLRLAGKNRRETWLPLPQDVGEALVDYLQNERPAAESGYVFIKSIAPVGKADARLVSSIVRRAIERTGIDTPSCGAHLIRHSAATAMLRQGASLSQIGSLLRHQSLETTLLYAKVDRDLLLGVAAPWPTIEPGESCEPLAVPVNRINVPTGGQN